MALLRLCVTFSHQVHGYKCGHAFKNRPRALNREQSIFMGRGYRKLIEMFLLLKRVERIPTIEKSP